MRAESWGEPGRAAGRPRERDGAGEGQTAMARERDGGLGWGH